MHFSWRRLAFVAAAALTVAVVTAPAWAAFPDQGNRILYVRALETKATMAPRGIDGDFDQFSIRNDGGDRDRVTDTAALVEYGGYYSPDGEQIVYWGQIHDEYRIYRADADGSHRRALTSNPVSMHPNWSKNGRKIVYARYSGAARAEPVSPFDPEARRRRGGGGALVVMDADGGGKDPIFEGSVLAPGWSPTRPEIAFSASGKSGYQTYLIPASGGAATPFCCKGGNAVFADWSPDGRRLLLLYQPPVAGPPVFQVISVRRNGTDPIPITDDSYYLTVPRFSDDGDRVIFSRPAGESLDLYSTRADGSGGLRPLTQTSRYLEFLNLLLLG